MFGNNMIGRIFALLVLTILVSPSLASALSPARYSMNATGDYYEIVFDQNGKAYVIERIELHNFGSGIDGLAFRIPASQVDNLHVIQVLGPDPCPVGGQCLMVYYENYYLLEVEDMENGFYRVKLNKSLDMDEHGTLVIYYETDDYADNGFANIDFQTTEWPFSIDKTRVAVANKNGINLTGYDDANLNEVYWEDLRNVGKDLQNATKGKFDSTALSRKAMNLRGAGGFIYETENVRAYETFHVPGHYKQMNEMWIHPVQPYPPTDFYPWPDPLWLGFLGGLVVAALMAVAWKLFAARFAEAI
jgi:hypothetical protein